MRKKLLTVAFVGMMVFSLNACGKNDDINTEDSSSNITTESSTQEAETEIKNDVSITEIHQAVKEAYGEAYLPSMQYDEATIKEKFGLSSDLYEEVLAEGPMISAHVDTFIGVKAKTGNVDAVKEALDQYRESLVQDTMQYPSNQLKIQASKVEQYGDYVFFLLLGEISQEVEEQDEDAIIKAAEEQNEIAITAIKKELGI